MNMHRFNDKLTSDGFDRVGDFEFIRILQVYTCDDRINEDDIYTIYTKHRDLFRDLSLLFEKAKKCAGRLAECNFYEFTEEHARLCTVMRELVNTVTAALKLTRTTK